jgi:hypothetical protein
MLVLLLLLLLLLCSSSQGATLCACMLQKAHKKTKAVKRNLVPEG